ncbi:MAG: peptidylprolyl isomerase [Proteobacteria bacterium]|nr:MAG: peptidylprolyl isomerase [Pseudomonadota bacterium]
MRITTNKWLAVSLIGLAFTTTQVWAEATQPADTANTASKPTTDIVAIVNGTEIERGTLDAILEMAKRSGAPPEQIDEKALLEDLVITELARQEAKKAGLAEREDIKQKVENFEDKLVLNTWMQEKANALEITEDDLKAAYDKSISSMPKSEYKARHILLKNKEDAEGIIKELADGKDFAELAKAKSTGPSGPMGGDLGWFKPDSMVKPFAEAVSSMEPGNVSKQPVETQFGWHVIKLEEKRDVKLPEMKNMKPQLKRQLEQEKMLEYMQSLRSGADVKILLPEKKPAETNKEEAAEKADKPVPPAE